MIIKDMQLFLFSTNPLFENWFERYRLKTLPLTFELEPPFILSVPYQASFRSETLGLRVHTLEADVLRPVPGQPAVVEWLASFPVLELRLFEPSIGRLALQMDCLHEKMIRYCLDILAEFEKVWPETMGQLSRPITRLLKAEDKYTSDPNWNFLVDVALPAGGRIIPIAELQDLHRWTAPAEAVPAGLPVNAKGNPRSLSGVSYEQRWQRLSEGTKIKFRKAWKIYQEMSREYQNDVLDGASTRAKPTTTDFRARVLARMKWKVGERRLRDVINLGEAGLIK
jgi:hypothetical protein